MPKTPVDDHPSRYIYGLHINNLEGRMLRVPARPPQNKKEILVVYGHHSSLERWWGLISFLRRYGHITMPDLPGFGGMDSFYKIGKQPTIDNLADYLASFVKLRYRKKRLTIIGMSFGFVIATRMLQKYPELVDQVDVVVSIFGLARYDDFKFTPARRFTYRAISKLLSFRIFAKVFRVIALNQLVLSFFYQQTADRRRLITKEIAADEMAYLMDFEVGLWHENDVRTYMKSINQLLKFDNCKKQLQLPVWHVAALQDTFLDNHVISQHLQIIYDKYHMATANVTTHAPIIVKDVATAERFIPLELRQVLKKR